MAKNSFYHNLNLLFWHYGDSWRAVSRGTGIPRTTIQEWWNGKEPGDEYVALVDGVVAKIKFLNRFQGM